MAEEKREKDQQESSEPKEAPNKNEESAELRERLLRLAAEFDNYKKRVAKEIDESKSLGKAEFVRKILPTLDEFELAIAAMDGGNGSAKGIEMVYANLLAALKAEGLQQIDGKGKADPYKHDVVMVREDGKEDGTIIEVVRKGYAFNGMLIRPASVIISKGKAQEGE